MQPEHARAARRRRPPRRRPGHRLSRPKPCRRRISPPTAPPAPAGRAPTRSSCRRARPAASASPPATSSASPAPRARRCGDLNLWSAADLSSASSPARPGRCTAPTSRPATGSGRACRICARWRRSPRTPSTGTASTASAAGVHDVIGTRCDPYTHRLLSGGDYHHCCHSNLTRALGGRDRPAARRGRGPCPRRPQRLHVHRLHPRHRPVLHEGEPGAPRRLPRALRRDRPPRRALRLPGRRLRGRAFQRRRRLPSAPGRDLPPARAAGRLDPAAAQRLSRSHGA